MAHKSIMAKPMIQTTRASYLKPIIKAEPENALPGGLNDQKITNLEMDITNSKIKTTEKIQRSSLGIRCKNSMNNYLMRVQI